MVLNSYRDVIMEKTGFYALVGEMNKKSVFSVKEITKKKWRSIITLLDLNYGKEQILPDYGYRVDKVRYNL